MTRLWPEGQAIDVTPDAHGIPVSFTWNGQVHRVSEVVQQWRVDTEWWRQRTWRAYYKLTTTSGLLVVVYQNLLTETWYLQRLYD